MSENQIKEKVVLISTVRKPAAGRFTIFMPKQYHADIAPFVNKHVKITIEALIWICLHDMNITVIARLENF